MIATLDDIYIVINRLKQIINNKDIVVLLQGDLASGKTTLVQKYLDSLKLKDKVTSPTFSLQSIYSNNIYHYDMYNKTLDEFISLGFLEEFEKQGVHFVEWGSNELKTLLKNYGFRVITIEIVKKENMREYIFES